MQLFPAFSVFCKSGQEGYGIALRIGRLLVQVTSSGFRDAISLGSSRLPLGWNSRNCSDWHQLSEAILSKIAQSWLWGCQIEVKKTPTMFCALIVKKVWFILVSGIMNFLFYPHILYPIVCPCPLFLLGEGGGEVEPPTKFSHRKLKIEIFAGKKGL